MIRRRHLVAWIEQRAFPTKLSPEWLLRVSLGVVYLWFGALKLVGVSPVLELVRTSYPILGTFPLYLALTVFELGLGTLLLAGVWKRWTAAAVVCHLLGTFGVLLLAPRISFYPWFPFLTMDGEFVIKNLVLMAAAVSLLVGLTRAPASAEVKPRLRVLVSSVLAGVLAVGFSLPYLHQSLHAVAEGSVSATPSNSTVVVRGVVMDRCRLLGCWMILQTSRSRRVFVNFMPGNLNAHGLARGERVQITGHVGATCNGTIGIIASGMKLLGSS